MSGTAAQEERAKWRANERADQAEDAVIAAVEGLIIAFRRWCIERYGEAPSEQDFRDILETAREDTDTGSRLALPAQEERLRTAVRRWSVARTEWMEAPSERSRKALVKAGDTLALLSATPRRCEGAAMTTPPFVVRQFEGTPWVPLNEAARLHDAVQESGLAIAALRNELVDAGRIALFQPAVISNAGPPIGLLTIPRCRSARLCWRCRLHLPHD